MSKKTWIQALGFLFISIMISACSSGNGNIEPNSTNGSSSPAGDSQQQGAADASEPVEISYLTHWSPPQVKQLEDLISEYTKQHPNVSIQVRAVPFGNLLGTLSTQSTSSNAPTITSIYDLWLPELVKNGIVTPAPEEYKQDLLASYPENILGATYVDGDYYGYPNEVNLYALNYNQALFDEAGLSGPPKNWDELIEYSEKLTKYDDSGRIVQQGFGLIHSWNSGVVHPWLSMLYSNGGHLINDDFTPNLDSESALEVTELYHQLIFDAKVSSPSMGTANASTTGPYLENFANGKTGMIIMANWWESALRDSMGDSFSNIKTAPIPVGPNGEGSHGVSYSWLTVVNSNATDAQQQAAWDFLKWLNSPDSGENGSSGMGDILMGMGILPSRTSDIEAHQDKLTSDFIKTYVDELQNAKPFPIILGGNEVTTRLQKQLERMEFGDAGPEEVLMQAQEEIQMVLGELYK